VLRGEAAGRFPADLCEKFRMFPQENLPLKGDNKIAVSPFDVGPAGCGMILADAGIG